MPLLKTGSKEQSGRFMSYLCGSQRAHEGETVGGAKHIVLRICTIPGRVVLVQQVELLAGMEDACGNKSGWLNSITTSLTPYTTMNKELLWHGLCNIRTRIAWLPCPYAVMRQVSSSAFGIAGCQVAHTAHDHSLRSWCDSSYLEKLGSSAGRLGRIPIRQRYRGPASHAEGSARNLQGKYLNTYAGLRQAEHWVSRHIYWPVV